MRTPHIDGSPNCWRRRLPYPLSGRCGKLGTAMGVVSSTEGVTLKAMPPLWLRAYFVGASTIMGVLPNSVVTKRCGVVHRGSTHGEASAIRCVQQAWG